MLQSLKQWFGAKSPPALTSMLPTDAETNPLMLQFFTWEALHPELSWWGHFDEEIPRLAELGITHVWLPPPNKAAATDGRGYDAYDLWDLGEFEQKGSIVTRWGTRDEFLSACKKAKQHGIAILIDAVLNHKLGADRAETFQAVRVNEKNRLETKDKPREIEGWTAFDFPGRGDKYSSFKWNQNHFNGLDWDQRTETKGVFRITGGSHKGWSKNVDKELGNYDYLLGLDINYSDPAVQEETKRWAQWILETTGAAGFRLDAIKHIDRQFLISWLRHARKTSPMGNGLFAVAEYWSGDVRLVLPYVKAFKGKAAFFDVPLHMNLHHASTHYSRYDLRGLMHKSLVEARPKDAVTFVDNHEVEGQSLESWVGSHFKTQAYAIILLRPEGYPCVFYGDLYPGTECSHEATQVNLTKLIRARKLYAYGPTTHYPLDKNCVGFVRMGDPKHDGCAVILSNKEDRDDAFIHTIRMNVGRKYAGVIFHSLLTEGGEVEIDADGWGSFTCFPNAAQVWVKEV
ncbi:glycoside hydrolase family 13 protein [Cylindrobasidium torrendii FP15055 ss-10]|uniref:Glycoside hydrolase family 13 protein n=1 Tax=Cylindrobasidium torrendii FP15055 ss-10 TaxID=1314674 RepID=A0A0D7B6P5_9AGAR|nr:glycoside hydrolase family 13 protein [Cylindrobasidium torrendii FP15055 ss-10]